MEWTTGRLAAVLTGVGFVASGVWQWTNVADEWMPNVATSAVGIAATITVVDRIVRREAERRIAPRLRRAYQDINDQLAIYGYRIAAEYARTHDASYVRPPSTRLADLIAHWMAHIADAELAPTLEDNLLLGGERLADELDGIRAANLDILDPDFAVECDEVARELRLQRSFYALLENVEGLPEDRYVHTAVPSVEAVDRFRVAFTARSGQDVEVDAPQHLLDGLEAIREAEMILRGRR